MIQSKKNLVTPRQVLLRRLERRLRALRVPRLRRKQEQLCDEGQVQNDLRKGRGLIGIKTGLVISLFASKILRTRKKLFDRPESLSVYWNTVHISFVVQ